MEIKETMEIEKKVYNIPELVVYGDLVEMTQGGSMPPDEAVGEGSRDPLRIVP